jgi:hypothetical protein
MRPGAPQCAKANVSIWSNGEKLDASNMFSASHPKPDIAQCGQHVQKVPTGDIRHEKEAAN